MQSYLSFFDKLVYYIAGQTCIMLTANPETCIALANLLGFFFFFISWIIQIIVFQLEGVRKWTENGGFCSTMWF